MRPYSKYLVMTVAAISLGACQTTGSDKALDAKATQTERIDSAMEKAAITASSKGSKSATLFALEKQYKRNSDNPAYALSYAQALRHAGFLNRASIVLSPFAKGDDAPLGTKTEMSMIALGLGDYDMAEKYAQNAIIQNPSDHYAYQNLGIALDAKEMHPEAERAFRKGLEHWQGDPTTVMNNLALNLATQGFIEEAIEVLEKAKALSPDRIEIERNLRIIRTLNER